MRVSEWVSGRVGEKLGGSPSLQPEGSLEDANAILQKSGLRAEPLGSDAIQKWIQENGVQIMNGGFWQKR